MGSLNLSYSVLGKKTITQTCANDRVVKEHIARNHEFFYLQVSSKGSAPELQNLSRNVVMCVFFWKQFRNFLNVSQFILKLIHKNVLPGQIFLIFLNCS